MRTHSAPLGEVLVKLHILLQSNIDLSNKTYIKKKKNFGMDWGGGDGEGGDGGETPQDCTHVWYE